MVRAPRRRGWIPLAAATLTGVLLMSLGCREIDRLAEPSQIADPGPPDEASAPPPAPLATGDVAASKTGLIGPVFPSLVGAHSAFCDPTTDPYGCI